MRLDEMYYTEIEMEGMKEILRDKEEEIKKLKDNIAWYEKEEDRLREENKLLKNEIAWMKDHTKYNAITEEYYIDGTMTATEAMLRVQQAEDNKNYVSKLEEEIKKLKSDLAFKNTMLDNVKAEYESSQDVIKELEERIRFLEQCLDNKEKVNKSLREENKRLSDFLECEA